MATWHFLGMSGGRMHVPKSWGHAQLFCRDAIKGLATPLISDMLPVELHGEGAPV